MPTYEYECPECGHHFDKFQSINAEHTADCPLCGVKSKSLISGGAGIIFKGSGFYETDYRSESYKKAEKADKAMAGSSSVSTPKKSE